MASTFSATQSAFQEIMLDLVKNMSFIGGGIVDEHGVTFEKKAVAAMLRLFKFWQDPQNRVLLNVVHMKELYRNTLTKMIDPEYSLYWHLKKQVQYDELSISRLIQQAKDTLALISV